MSDTSTGIDLWFRETFGKGTGLSLKVKALLHQEVTPFQEVHIFETEDWGRLMTLDGCVMFTDRDEFVYHEMISHVPLCAHPNPKKVLVIGGGDGGAIREILRHPTIEQVDLVEIDEAVIRLTEQYFPAISCKLRDPKVKIHVKDGIAFAAKSKGRYDVILVDSTDYVGMAEGLSATSFFQHIKGALREGGILVMQSEDAWFFEKELRRLYKNLREVFKTGVYAYYGGIPTYVSGTWTFALVSPYDPVKDLDVVRAEAIAKETRYYNARLHAGAFALPNFITQKMAPEKEQGKKKAVARKDRSRKKK